MDLNFFYQCFVFVLSLGSISACPLLFALTIQSTYCLNSEMLSIETGALVSEMFMNGMVRILDSEEIIGRADIY